MTMLQERESNTAVKEREVVERPTRYEPPTRAKRSWMQRMILLLVVAVVGAGLTVAILASQEEQAAEPLNYHVITADEAEARFGPFQLGLSYRVMDRDYAEDRFGPFRSGLTYHRITAQEADARFGPFPKPLIYHKITAAEASARFGPFPQPLKYHVMTQQEASARFGPFLVEHSASGAGGTT